MTATQPREVMLLEECDDLREVLCEVLGARGYHVLAYGSLAEALRAPAQALHAILVAVNGYFGPPQEHLGAAIAQWQSRHVPVLALVSGDRPVHVEGVAASLRKPVDEERLCSALERCAGCRLD